MPQLERLADAHDGFAKLLEELPRDVLVAIVCAAAGLSVSDIAYVRVRNPNIDVPGLERRAGKRIADLVLTIHTHGGGVIDIWIIEVQLVKDASKRWSWMVLLAGFGAELHCNGKIIAWCIDPVVREWVRRTFGPRFGEQLVIIEQDHVHLIDDVSVARNRPIETLVGATHHARGTKPEHLRVAGIRAAIWVLQRLDTHRRRRYGVTLMSLAPMPLVQRALDELSKAGELQPGYEEELSDAEIEGYLYGRGLAKGRVEGHAEGRVEGHAEGRAETLREAIVDILELRGLTLLTTTRARIDACTDIHTLEAWYADARSPAPRPDAW